MQLFSADATIFLKKLKFFFYPQNIKNLPSKVAHNPTRPRVFSPASFCFVQLSFKKEQTLKKPVEFGWRSRHDWYSSNIPILSEFRSENLAGFAHQLLKLNSGRGNTLTTDF